jgi:hypothetical protein
VDFSEADDPVQEAESQFRQLPARSDVEREGDARLILSEILEDAYPDPEVCQEMIEILIASGGWGSDKELAERWGYASADSIKKIRYRERRRIRKRFEALAP